MNEPRHADELKRKLESYKPSAETIELIRQTPIVLLVGVSGAGKNSIKQQLLMSGDYHDIISHTTRAPRENKGIMEQDGREYHFINLDQAEAMLDNQGFVEAKMYSGNIYGTSVSEFQKAQDDHKIALADIEVQGVAEYAAIAPQLKAIFLLPPSYDVWQQRLKSRYKESDISPLDIMRRMQTADAELKEALQKDYFQFVINNDLNQAVAAVNAVAHGAPAGQESEAARTLAKELLSQLD